MRRTWADSYWYIYSLIFIGVCLIRALLDWVDEHA